MKKANLVIFSIGILSLIVGNILLSMGPATNVWSLSVAPVVLLIAFLILLPLSIMYRSKVSKKD